MLRDRVREFIETVMRPIEDNMDESNRSELVSGVIEMRKTPRPRTRATEVSMAKHFVANSLNRIIDRAIQVHGALGYSTDTPLAEMAQHARWARFADGADEVHQWRIAQRAIEAYTKTGSVGSAAGDLPL